MRDVLSSGAKREENDDDEDYKGEFASDMPLGYINNVSYLILCRKCVQLYLSSFVLVWVNFPRRTPSLR